MMYNSIRVKVGVNEVFSKQAVKETARRLNMDPQIRFSDLSEIKSERGDEHVLIATFDCARAIKWGRKGDYEGYLATFGPALEEIKTFLRRLQYSEMDVDGWVFIDELPADVII
ncbi:MAG: hypothetical protein ACI4CS_11030 [Candidatus Weimeria sp.]